MSYTSFLLYPETKELLKNVDKNDWLRVLDSQIRNISYQNVHLIEKYSIDLIYLLGLSHGDIGISTAIPLNVGIACTSVTLNQSLGYGITKVELNSHIPCTFRIDLNSSISKPTVVKTYVKQTDSHIRLSYIEQKSIYNRKSNSLSDDGYSPTYNLFYFFNKDTGKPNVKVTKDKQNVYNMSKVPYQFVNKALDFLYNSILKQPVTIYSHRHLQSTIMRIKNPVWAAIAMPVIPYKYDVSYGRLKRAYTKGGAEAVTKLFYQTSDVDIIEFIKQQPINLTLFESLRKHSLMLELPSKDKIDIMTYIYPYFFKTIDTLLSKGLVLSQFDQQLNKQLRNFSGYSEYTFDCADIQEGDSIHTAYLKCSYQKERENPHARFI